MIGRKPEKGLAQCRHVGIAAFAPSGQRGLFGFLHLPGLIGADAGKGFEPGFSQSGEIFSSLGKCGNRSLDTLPHGGNLTFARKAEFVEPLEARYQFFQLQVRRAPGIADVVGHVLGRIGDNRQLCAQLFHIVERGG